MSLGVSRARFEELVQEHGFTVKEHQLDIYSSSLGRTDTETFLGIMNGDEMLLDYGLNTIEQWVDEEYVIGVLEKLKGDLSIHGEPTTTGTQRPSFVQHRRETANESESDPRRCEQEHEAYQARSAVAAP